MIEETEMNALIEQERQKLRDERNARGNTSGETSANLVGDRTNTDGSIRSGVQTFRRESTETRTGNDTSNGDESRTGSTKRGTETESIGVRSQRRRLGSINTRATNTQQETGRTDYSTFTSGIERVDGEFFRPEPKKEEKKKVENLVTKLVEKLPSSSEDIPFIGSSGKTKVFSKTEAQSQYEPLKQAISDYGDYIDMYMQKFEPDLPPCWSNFTEKELDIVTRALLRQAQTNPGAARFTRLMIDGQDYIGAFVILVPRVVVTLQFTGRRLPRKAKKRENNN